MDSKLVYQELFDYFVLAIMEYNSDYTYLITKSKVTAEYTKDAGNGMVIEKLGYTLDDADICGTEYHSFKFTVTSTQKLFNDIDNLNKIKVSDFLDELEAFVLDKFDVDPPVLPDGCIPISIKALTSDVSVVSSGSNSISYKSDYELRYKTNNFKF